MRKLLTGLICFCLFLVVAHVWSQKVVFCLLLFPPLYIVWVSLRQHLALQELRRELAAYQEVDDPDKRRRGAR